ncbi:MAG: hypothetical protein ABI442_19655 [Gemmatimonadaceae bacterium]
MTIAGGFAYSAMRVVGLAIGVFAAFVLARRFVRGGAVELGLYRARRAKGRRGDADVGSAAAYHDGLPSSDRTDALDDRTWRDLDLDDVFLAVDYTVSQPGRQYLYHLLRTPARDAIALGRLETAVRRASSDSQAVDRARTALASLDDRRAAGLINLVFGDLPARPRFWWLFPLLPLGSIACLFAIVVWPRAFIVWLAICVANVVLQIIYKPRVRAVASVLHEIPRFVHAASALGRLDVPEWAAHTQQCRDGAAELATLRRATSWLQFEPGQSNELVASIYEYVNLLFLLDINAFVIASETLRESRDVMRGVFEAIGYLDAAQSIAAWRATLQQWTAPETVDQEKRISFESLFHPLLQEPVANSLDTAGSSVLITGSNMSGKTTFVRTVGVNAVLASTLHTVCAGVWRAPSLHVRTSIGRADSIMEGKSYYLAEVESVGELIRAKESGQQHLFLLDEIFRGTNTTERVAAAYAVLAYLDRGNDIVIVATHDIEVIDLLGGRYSSYHFREEIVGGSVEFDYRIRPGQASSRNAIALLQVMNFPSEIVSDAIAALDWKSR